MALCSKCGKQVSDSSLFCSFCGTPVSKTEVKQEVLGSTVVIKYQKNIMFIMLVEPLDVTIDRNLKFKIVDGREVAFNLSQGNHTLTAYVPYIGGTKCGEITKNFYVGLNEKLEILYKPPLAVFMTGNITIKKIR